MPARTTRRRKAMGQHFLADGRVAERQVGHAELRPEDTVLEVGPGTGALTRRLAPRVRRLVAIERDAALARRLQDEFAQVPSVEVLTADATEFDYPTLGPIDKVVANLPYSVSTPITFRLLPLAWDVAVLMYQLEFAQRLAAEVGQKAYGRLSAARAYFATAELVETVPPGAFHPPPQVESGVVKLRRHRRPPFAVAEPEAYLELLRIAFSTRRKTLRATLRHQHRSLGLASPDAIEAVLDAWGRGGDRPERVPPAEFGRLSLLLAEARGHE
jgi:16S rRNA (adenine1518-N6/adenine1519-N6)-dimethyltransferase